VSEEQREVHQVPWQEVHVQQAQAPFDALQARREQAHGSLLEESASLLIFVGV